MRYVAPKPDGWFKVALDELNAVAKGCRAEGVRHWEQARQLRQQAKLGIDTKDAREIAEHLGNRGLDEAKILEYVRTRLLREWRETHKALAAQDKESEAK